MAAEAHSKDNVHISWPTDPKYYQWKGTLSVNNGTWNVLAHCKPRKEDVFLKIKQILTQDDDIDEFLENTKNLINIRHNNLLTPVHSFVNKSEIWVVYPRHSGGYVNIYTMYISLLMRICVLCIIKYIVH